MPYLIYLHGFNSSEQSHKATLIQQRMLELGKPDCFLSPRLDWQPAVAIAQASALIEANLAQGVTLIGSSLGGYYATYLAEKYALKTILVNPAVAAHELLVDYLGPQTNPYTYEAYVLTRQHMQQLQALDVLNIEPEYYWLMLQEGDEVLNYRHALAKYPHVRLTCEPDGDHSFVQFERFIDDILVYAGLL